MATNLSFLVRYPSRLAAAVIGLSGLMSHAIWGVEPGKPSVSALEVTAYRAIGAKHPDPSIRNADVLAEKFLGAEERAILKAAGADDILAALQMDTEKAWASLARPMFARAVHARTRHIDAVFDDSLETGARQVVILGAGLDSRAYRAPDSVHKPECSRSISRQPRSTRRSVCSSSSARFRVM